MFLLKFVVPGIFLSGLVALGCNTDPTVSGWLYGIFDLLQIDQPGACRWIIQHPKLWHVLYYFLATATLFFFWRGRYLLIPLLAFAVGALIEIAQIFVPTRSARVEDLFFNLLGIAVATAVVFIMNRIWRVN